MMGDNPLEMKVERGASKGLKFEVKSEAIVLGSDESADIVLPGPGVEPRHAQIVFQGGRVILEDLGTQAGTSRNGKRLLGPVQVFPGDRIGLGPEVELILEGDDPREGAPEDPLPGETGLAEDPGQS